MLLFQVEVQVQLIVKDRWKKNHIIIQLNLHSEYSPPPPTQNANRKIVFLLLWFVCLFMFGGGGRGCLFVSEITLNDRK